MVAVIERQPIKASIAAFVGTMVEWYDFYIYAFASALIFGHLFFKTDSQFIATMASFATFSIGFFVRPLGAVIFGYVGDKVGRKKTLIITLFLMGFATVGIGLLPTYAQVGVMAPILLVALRILQGLAVSGEWGGAVLIAAEHAPKGRRTFFASFAQLGSPAGLILATIAFRLISNMEDEALYSYGWRLPFLASFVLLVIGFIIRAKVSESPEFEAEKKAQEERSEEDREAIIHKVPALEIFRTMPRVIFLAICANVIGIAGFFFVNTFMLNYTTTYLAFDRKTILNILLIISILQFLSQPICALIGEKVGPHRFLVVSSFLCLFTPYLMFILLNTENLLLMTIGIAITVIIMAGYYAVVAGFMTTLFPVRLRYTGISIASSFCAAISGGLTPIIGTTIAEMFPASWVPLAMFYTLLALITLVAVYQLNPKNMTTY